MEYIQRYIEPNVQEDLSRKMVMIGGPRQTGKTTLAKRFLKDPKRYLNWDAGVDREEIIRENFPAGPGCMVLDEIHKYSNWRQVVKGLFDKRGKEVQIIVTGSARLDYYRRGGDSLQGRYHFHRLLPFSFKEVKKLHADTLERLLAFSGFPEPFLAASERHARRWSREYRTMIIHNDLNDLEKVADLGKLEHTAIRLPDLVGSPLSVNALCEDIRTSHRTMARYIDILERLYMIFRLYPFGTPKVRAVHKEPKHYHYDWTLVEEPDIRFENLLAVHLLKWVYYQQDTEGRDIELRYFRDRDGREVDFVILEKNKPLQFIEAKLKFKGEHRPLRYRRSVFQARKPFR